MHHFQVQVTDDLLLNLEVLFRHDKKGFLIIGTGKNGIDNFTCNKNDQPGIERDLPVAEGYQSNFSYPGIGYSIFLSNFLS